MDLFSRMNWRIIFHLEEELKNPETTILFVWYTIPWSLWYKIRNYKDSLEAALYPKKIDSAVYRNLIKTVKANLKPLHRYLKLKEKMLKLDKIKYDDIYASSVPGVEKKYTIEEAKNIVLKFSICWYNSSLFIFNSILFY